MIPNTSIVFSSIEILGICDKNVYASIKAHFLNAGRNPKQAQIRISIVPPVFTIAKLVIVSRDRLSDKIFRYSRRLVSLFIKNPKLFLPGFSKWTVKIKFDRSQEELVVETLSQHDATYVSRYLYPTVNLKPKTLTMSHSQILDKNFSDYNAYWLYVKSAKYFSNNLSYLDHVTKSFYEWESINPPLEISNINEFSDMTHGELKYCCIEDVTVAHGACVFDTKKYYFTDSSRINLPCEFYHGANPAYCSGTGIKILPFKIVQKLKEGIFLGGLDNIMHFVLEDLIRLQQFEKMVCVKVPIIITESTSINIVNALRDLSRREIVTCSPFEGIVIEKLHILMMKNPLPLAMEGDALAAERLFATVDQDLGTFVRNRLKDQGKLYPIAPLTRVVIVRSKGLFRVMKNQDRLLSTLIRTYGFTPIDPSKLPFDEMARKLQFTEILLGQYGAGLANSIFLRPNSTVIQIKGPRDTNCLEYSMLFEHLGLKEKIVEDRASTISRILHSPGNFKVNIEGVESVINSL